MKNFQKQMQSGRSLLEMIGVISLMGLLSVGGIYGYKQAHDSYRANVLKDIVFQGKLVVETAKRGATVNTLEVYAQKARINCPSGSCVTGPENANVAKKSFSLSSQEQSGVCEEILGRKKEFENFDIIVSPTSCTGTSPITMTFSFDVNVRHGIHSIYHID